MINSILGPVSHCYWDTTTYWLKIANFPTPSHLASSFGVRGDPLRIYEKVLRFLKQESSRQPTVKIWWSLLAPFLIDPPVWRTHGRTERIATAKTRWKQAATSAFARKKTWQKKDRHRARVRRTARAIRSSGFVDRTYKSLCILCVSCLNAHCTEHCKPYIYCLVVVHAIRRTV